ncbi:hypothetical protein [Streptomyces sp. NPDC053069]|uniref:hypothetical protein n=1 Tax=Streptomyces sp. NPDC053069 TaxID=3365695 RepID=UPI0037D56C68
MDNLFTITQNPANSPHMRDLELEIRDAVLGKGLRKGEVVQYSVHLEYTDDKKTSVPKWITMEADGHRGFHLAADFVNPDHAAQQIRRRNGIE